MTTVVVITGGSTALTISRLWCCKIIAILGYTFHGMMLAVLTSISSTVLWPSLKRIIRIAICLRSTCIRGSGTPSTLSPPCSQASLYTPADSSHYSKSPSARHSLSQSTYLWLSQQSLYSELAQYHLP